MSIFNEPMSFDVYWSKLRDKCSFEHHWSIMCVKCNRAAAEAAYQAYLAALGA